MAGRLTWSPRAAAHLEGICEYIGEDSPVYARIFAKRVMAIVLEIPRFPRSGRVVPEYDDEDLREKLMADYRIVYRIRRNAVEIVAICHGAMLLRHVL